MHTLKNIFSLLLLFISLAAVAQENIRPTFDVRLEREVSSIKIDNKEYADVVIEIDADAYKTQSSKTVGSLGDSYAYGTYIEDVDYDGVRITVKKKETDKTLYKKRFKKSFLYGLPDGTIKVGKDYVLTQLIISKKDGIWTALLKEKGIY